MAAPGVPFKRGCKPGPGRPKGSVSANDIVRRLLGERSDKRPGLTREQSIWRVALDLAEDGDRHFWAFVTDRAYGPIVKQVEIADTAAAAAAMRAALASTAEPAPPDSTSPEADDRPADAALDTPPPAP